jgi:hypothetical protein
MADDRDSAQALERRVKADAEARLNRARAEGRRVVEGVVAPQGVVAGGEVGPVYVRDPWKEHGKGHGRRQAIRALARDPDFQHPDGTPNLKKIARGIGCDRKDVRKALEVE